MLISKAYAAGEDAAGAAADSGVFPPFDTSTFASQLFWLAITFGFFYWFISKVISPRIGEILETRQDRIAQDLAKAQDLSDETNAAIAVYEQDLATAKANAGEIGQKARDKAKAEAEAERAKVDEDLAAKLSEAETRIADIRTKAMGEVGSIAQDTAAELVEKLVGVSVTKADLTKAISGK
ncbi:MAG: F0F1 ATP synthase subunit B [Pseudomonadota bacterium]